MTIESIPSGATHYQDCYGRREFFRLVAYQHLNQVSEEWQTLGKWYFWTNSQWFPEHHGFSTRNLVQLEPTPIH
jgi:hypothetical protein